MSKLSGDATKSGTGARRRAKQAPSLPGEASASAKASPSPMSGAFDLPLELLRPNPDQPRKTFTKEALARARESVREHGIIEPLIVRRQGGKYVIICGEIRYRAAMSLGRATVPVIVRDDVDEVAALWMSLEENGVREGLNLLDSARFLQGLIDRGVVKNRTALADRLGLTPGRISQRLEVLRLPPRIQALFARHAYLGELHARVFLHIEDPQLLDMVVERVISGELCAKEAMRLAQSARMRDGDRPRPQVSTHGVAALRRTRTGYTLRLPDLPSRQLAEVFRDLGSAIAEGRLRLPEPVGKGRQQC